MSEENIKEAIYSDIYKESYEDDKKKRTSTIDANRNSDMVLNLDMSAQQMRELVGRRKKWDPRTEEKMDWWKKHQIIQTL